VVVVHCLAGRGRTGTVITSYLLFAGICNTINDALTFYAHQRSATCQGVSQPSQRRSARYLDAVLRYRIYPKPKRLRLLKLVFGPAPRISSRGGWRPLIYLYNYSNCTEESLFLSETTKEKALFVPENNYFICDLTRTNVEMTGDIVLKISHIGGLIATKYEEIIRLIFHTGTEAMRQWGGGWPETCETLTSPPNTPMMTPTGTPQQSPDSSLTFSSLPPRVTKEEYYKHMLLASESPIPPQQNLHDLQHTPPSKLYLPLANEVPNVLPERETPVTDQVQKTSAPVSRSSILAPFLSPLGAFVSGFTSAIQQNTGDVAPQTQIQTQSQMQTQSQIQTPLQVDSPPEVPSNSLVTPLDPQPSSQQPRQQSVPQLQALVFAKKDLDNAYKMDDTKFPSGFTIRFECALIDNDDVPTSTWDEHLYQEFLATYEVNKNNHEASGKTLFEDKKTTLLSPRKDGLHEGWSLFDRPPPQYDVLF